MVQISRTNIPRRIRGGNGTLLGQLQAYADSLSYLARLSPVDRMLVVVGASLLFVVSLSYFLLISGIFASYGPAGGAGGMGILGGGSADPRLSSDLRKIGLSKEVLLRRGGGRRIRVGAKQLDAIKNAVALDIAKALECNALQEEVEREWQRVLDDAKLSENHKPYYGYKNYNKPKERGGGSPYGNDGKLARDWEASKADDYAAELAGEVGAAADRNYRRRLQYDADDYGRDDTDRDPGYQYSYKAETLALKMTARHLFCLAAKSLTLPKSTKPSVPDPATK